MDVQAIFYTLGSIFLILGIVVMVSLVILIWKAYETMQQAKKGVENLKDDFVGKATEFISSKPSLIAGSVGAGLSSLLMKKVRSFFNKHS